MRKRHLRSLGYLQEWSTRRQIQSFFRLWEVQRMQIISIFITTCMRMRKTTRVKFHWMEFMSLMWSTPGAETWKRFRASAMKMAELCCMWMRHLERRWCLHWSMGMTEKTLWSRLRQRILEKEQGMKQKTLQIRNQKLRRMFRKMQLVQKRKKAMKQ